MCSMCLPAGGAPVPYDKGNGRQNYERAALPFIFLPFVSGTWPARALSKEVLPPPDGPMMARSLRQELFLSVQGTG